MTRAIHVVWHLCVCSNGSTQHRCIDLQHVVTLCLSSSDTCDMRHISIKNMIDWLWLISPSFSLSLSLPPPSPNFLFCILMISLSLPLSISPLPNHLFSHSCNLSLSFFLPLSISPNVFFLILMISLSLPPLFSQMLLLGSGWSWITLRLRSNFWSSLFTSSPPYCLATPTSLTVGSVGATKLASSSQICEYSTTSKL